MTHKIKMEKTFNKIGKLFNNHDDHFWYAVKWSYLRKLNIEKWSGNRDCDENRVKELEDFYLSGGYFPRVLSLATTCDADVSTVGHKLICYDGNHRRNAFNRLNDGDLMIIVDIMFKVTQSDIFKAFKNINKSIQVPSIYLDYELLNVKDDIIKLVNSYCLRYPDFTSTSSKCHRPSFNRDLFVEDVGKIYLYFENKVPISGISKLLDELNANYGKKQLNCDHKKLSLTVREKCKMHDFWLFSMDRTISINHLEKIKNKS